MTSASCSPWIQDNFIRQLNTRSQVSSTSHFERGKYGVARPRRLNADGVYERVYKYMGRPKSQKSSRTDLDYFPPRKSLTTKHRARAQIRRSRPNDKKCSARLWTRASLPISVAIMKHMLLLELHLFYHFEVIVKNQ